MEYHANSKLLSKLYVIIVLSGFFGTSLNAQNNLTEGCNEARFGVDADCYANGAQFGVQSNIQNDIDDWFLNKNLYSGIGIGIIDTTGSDYIHNIIKAKINLALTRKMNVPLNSLYQGVRNLDAIYGRDFYGGTRATDSTAYTSASKNGESPEIWDVGPMNVTPKNDLIDCYGHLRRDGITSDANLWLFTGFSRISNSGESYLDAELYAQDIFYNAGSGFVSFGEDEGHTAWKFDASGNITQVGDLVMSVNYSTSEDPEIELRIWTSRQDYLNVNPKNFNFGAEFDGSANNSIYGYADITPPANGIYGCGLSNTTTTFAPPWGTLNSRGDFSYTYDKYQFVEIGINLKAFGIDPALSINYDGTNNCIIPFSGIMFKSRASSSFTAQLKDFAGPYPFGIINTVPTTIQGDTLTCEKTTIELQPEVLIADAFYHWETIDGNIISFPDSSHIQVDRPGTYILFGAPAKGCFEESDTFYVTEILDIPLATIQSDTIMGCDLLQAHLVGGEDNMIYQWSGPDNFSSVLQEVDVAVTGLYILMVTDPLSLCTALDSIYFLDRPCETPEAGLLPSDSNMVTIIDQVPPEVIIPMDITIDCNDDPLDLTITGRLLSFADDCPGDLGEPYYIDIPSSDASCGQNLAIFRLWYQFDACGNLANGLQRIVLADQTPPDFIIPADLTLDCNVDITDLSLTGTFSGVQDDCDLMIELPVYRDSIEANPDCNGNQLVFRIWTLSDFCGNTASKIQVIQLVDQNAPIFNQPPDVTISCEQDPDNLLITGTASSETDDCDSGIGTAIYTDEVLSNFPCSGASQITRTWSLTDDCGNTSTAVQIITVTDTTAPTFDLPVDITIQCNQDPIDLGITGMPSGLLDQCDVLLSAATFSDEITENTPCDGSSIIVRTWTLIDDCGNTNSSAQTITLTDDTAPQFTPPADVTISCTDDPNELSLTGDVFNETDECSNIGLLANYTDVITSNNGCTGGHIITRTWTLTDDCGNTNSENQTITVEDRIAPFFLTFILNPEVECDSIVPLPIIGVDVITEDACVDTSEITIHFEEIQVNGSCPGVYSLTRIWIAEDPCGNKDSLVQIVNVEDTNDPIILSFPPDITISCDASIPNFNPVVNDNCDSSPTLNVTESRIDGNCASNYTLSRAWNWTDNCGNDTTIYQEIIVVDLVPPVFSLPTDITISCTQDPNDLALTGNASNGSDNCDPNPTAFSYTDSLVTEYGCEGTSLILRVWSLSDECGNTATQIQEILQVDDTAPTFVLPVDVTISCDQDPEDLGLTGTVSGQMDACDPALGEATFRDSVLINEPCMGSRIIFRTWNLVDGCGNETSSIQKISMLDRTSPDFDLPPDVTINCTENANDLTLTGTISNTNDACNAGLGNAVYADSLVGQSPCNGASVIYRKWTLEDACGNDTTKVQVITIEDNLPPFFTPPSDLTISCDQNPGDLVLTGEAINEADACAPQIGVAAYSDSLVTENYCAGSAMIIRKWTLTDACGNDTTMIQRIAIEDHLPPVLTAPSDITISCIADRTDLNITGGTAAALDDCDPNLSQATYKDSIVVDDFCKGAARVFRIWTASDACGNIESALQIIEVIDTIAPSFQVPADITMSCDADQQDLTLSGEPTAVTDLCSGLTASLTYSDSLILEAPCRGSQIIYRRWIAADDCGNRREELQIIHLVDQQTPVFETPADITIDCADDPSQLLITGSITIQSDNCDDQLGTAIYTDSLVTGGACGGAGSIYRRWSLSDACGNTYTDLQKITLEDIRPPVFYPPADLIIDCQQDPLNLTLTGVSTDEYDLCDDNIGQTTFRDSVANQLPCAGSQIVYRIWELSDACGNMNSFTQIISVLDTLAPVFTVPSDTLLSCDADFNDLSQTGDVLDEQDNCDPTLGEAQFTDSIIVLNNCVTDRIIYRNWYLTDACGNDTVMLQVITLKDTLAPLFTQIPQDTTYDCSELIPTGDTITANDNCTSSIIVNYTENRTEGPCVDIYFLNRRWIATDDCGNADTIFQVITVMGCSPEIELSTSGGDTVCEGEETSFEANLSSVYPQPVFQWQYKSSSLSRWTNILNATQSEYHIDSVQTLHGGFYRVIIASSDAFLDQLDCSSISDSLQLTVLETPAPMLIDTSLCEGEQIVIGGNPYSTSGDHLISLSAINGCDSIITLRLQIIPISITLLEVDLCDGESYEMGSQQYNSSGSYLDTLLSAIGCDSIVNLRLNVHPQTNVTVVDRLCEGNSYQGILIRQDTTFEEIVSDQFGCDSIITYQLQVLNVQEQIVFTEICEGDSIYLGNAYQKLAGRYTDSLLTVEACDSILITELIVHPKILIIDTFQICRGDSLFFEGSWQAEAGLFYDTLVGSNGCDSIRANELVIVDIYSVRKVVEICDGETYWAGGTFQTGPGFYRDTLIRENGCDSIIHTSILIKTLVVQDYELEICEGDSIFIIDSYKKDAGLYSDTINALVGCDSILNYRLRILDHTEELLTFSICEGDSLMIDNSVYTRSGTYTNFLMNAEGCDSILTLVLHVEPTQYKTIDASICEGESYPLADSSYTESGRYEAQFLSGLGCDSIVYLNLNVLPNSNQHDYYDLCEGESYFAGGANQNLSGIYLDTLISANGCDSFLFTQITVFSIYSDTVEIDFCEGDSVTIGGQVYFDSTQFTEQFLSSEGCDSMIHYQVNSIPIIFENVQVNICEGTSFFVGGALQSVEAIYFDTLSSSLGCDSIVRTDLRIRPVYQTELAHSICEGDQVFLAGMMRDTEGVYADTFSTQYNCDSIILNRLILIPERRTESLVEICEGDLYQWRQRELSTTGTYTDTLLSFLGCDSILQLQLMVHPIVINELNINICEGEQYMAGDANQSTSGIYTDTLISSNTNCDSIVITHLEVHPTKEVDVLLSFCEGDSMYLGGTVFYESGIYTDSLVTPYGCDSLIHYQFLALAPVYNNLSVSICEGERVQIGEQFYSTPGNYTDTLLTFSGCDSIVITQLEVLPAYKRTSVEAICEGEGVDFAGIVRTESGTYTDSLSTSEGCDSILQLQLTVHPIRINELNINLCEGEQYMAGGANQSTSGIYTDTLISSNTNCDSIVITHLEVHPNKEVEVLLSFCEGDSMYFGGMIFYESGIYTDSLRTSYGCDSLIHYQFLALAPVYNNLFVSICEGERFQIGEQFYSTQGNYTDTLLAFNGCDSIVITQLEVLPAYETTSAKTICEGERIYFAGAIRTESGTYTDSLRTSGGCDSILHMDLLVTPYQQHLEEETICEGERYKWNAHYYEIEGVYYDTLLSLSGCYVFSELNLKVLPKRVTTLFMDICEGDSYLVGGALQTSSGVYTDTLLSQSGCDSLVEVHLDFFSPYQDTLQVSLCEGEYYILDGQQINQAGSYLNHLLNQNGCDSIVLVNLEFLDSPSERIEMQLCEGEFYEWNGGKYSVSGIYSDTLQSSSGCDSTQTLDLKVIAAIRDEIMVGICQNDSIWLGNDYQTVSGVYEDHYVSSEGCDSMVVSFLEVYEQFEKDTTFYICEGDSFNISGVFYHSDTILIEEHNGLSTCDSTIIYHLLVEPPVNLISDEYEICKGDSISLLVEGAEDVEWSPAYGLSCTNCPNPVASPEVTTTYYVSAPGCNGSTAKTQITVYVNTRPDIIISVDAEILLGDTLLLTARSKDWSTQFTWLTENGDTICQNCSDSIWVQPNYSTKYIVMAYSQNACTTRDEVAISVRRECEFADLFIPNFITPNNDGSNDEFVITYSGVKELKVLRIYNRWGELVFQTTNIRNEHWDGHFRGRPVNPGVYVYYLEGICLDEQPLLTKGNITVIR